MKPWTIQGSQSWIERDYKYLLSAEGAVFSFRLISIILLKNITFLFVSATDHCSLRESSAGARELSLFKKNYSVNRILPFSQTIQPV